MIDQLALHDTTAAQLKNFLKNPSHAVLITGPDGIGKTAIGEAIICALLKLEAEKFAGHPHVSRISPTNNTISIEAIRDLQRFLQLKTIGTDIYRRAVLIEHAQGLSIEAQNAYLKLLEEPPTDTVMVITADSPRSLLPTIRSRLQTITVTIPDETALQPILRTTTKDDTTTKQAYFLSGGLPGLLCALIQGDETHPMLTHVATAKDILQKQPFERLSIVDALSKQKDTARGVLAAMERIAQTGINGATAKRDAGRIKQWHNIRKHTLAAREAIDHSANAKLALTHLFLTLS